jgi:DnaJ-domain-containing protein 1
MLALHADLARRLEQLEQKNDQPFAVVFEAIRQLMAESDDPKRTIIIECFVV